MFVVIRGTAIPEHLHGYLSRFLSEVDPGLYIGVVSRAVMENLWKRCERASAAGTIALIHNTPENEQGFDIRTAGDQRRRVINFDGCLLLTRGKAQEDRIAPNDSHSQEAELMDDYDLMVNETSHPLHEY